MDAGGRPANLGTQHSISAHFDRAAAHSRHRCDVPARDRWVIVAVVEADTPVLRGLARPDDGGREPVLVRSLVVLGGVEAAGVRLYIACSSIARS